MTAAIRSAILANGYESEAIIVSGQPSYRKGSNCRKAADAAGFKSYRIYTGAKRRYDSEGYKNVLVKIS